jgi:biopolymer transport protein TolR
MAFSMPGGGPSNPEINVTPLIDVLLVLIIVFMIIVTQQRKKGLDAQIPQPVQEQQNQPLPPIRTIVIQVVEGVKDQPPALRINQESVSWENLKGRLQGIFKMRAERVAFVQGDDKIDFQYVADVIDIARNAGVERVGLLGKERRSEN